MMEAVRQYVTLKRSGTSNTPKVPGDTLDAMPVGSVTPAAGAFTILKASTDPADEHGVGDRGYNDLRYASILSNLDTISDPAVNAAVTTAKIDAYDGTIITLSAGGNAQTLQNPTAATVGKKFIVVNNDTSGANTIEVNGITLSAGEAQWFIWDGSAWVAITAVDADDIAFTPAGSIIATNVQTAIEELDTEKLANVVEDTTPQLGGTLDSNAKQIRLSKGADVASANALALGTDGNYFDITGVTAITSIGTLGIGIVVTLHFDGILVLTHHATDLILPGSANITTAAGDEATFIEYDTGDWRCVEYQRAVRATAFSDIKQAATEDATGVLEKATTAEVVTGTDIDRAVTPAGVTARMAEPGAIGGTTPAAGAFTTLDVPALILNMTIPSGITVEVQTGKHLQYLTADDNRLTVEGILQVDGTFLFMDLG